MPSLISTTPARRRLVSAVYTYDLDELGRVWKVSNQHYTSGVRCYVNMYDGNRLIRVDADGWLYHYDGDRILSVERDGGYWESDVPDGTPNMRFAWHYDGDVLIGFTQDGTDSTDNPYINGVPDYVEGYTAGCSSLFEQFPWLRHDPGPDSIGPRFRTDRH